MGYNTTFPQLFPPDLITESAAVIFPFDNLTIRAGEVAVVNMTISFPSTVDSKRIPIISGYINIESSKNESFHLPYGGVACNMKEVKITDFDQYPPEISIFESKLGSNQIQFEWRMLMGSSIVRLDIRGSGTQTEAVGVNILGSIPNYPSYFMSRNSFISLPSSYTAIWNGSLNSSVQVPDGNYTILYRALKIFGDPNNNDDYENYTSPVIRIVNGPFIIINSTTSTTTTTTSAMNRSQHPVTSSAELFIFLIVALFCQVELA